MTGRLPRIRNGVFYAQSATFVVMMCVMGPRFFPLCGLFGAAGLAVLLLTLPLDEPRLQKGFFLLAGGAGTAALVTLATFLLLASIDRIPGGDGGGITVPILIVVCPALFLIGAIGATACRLTRTRDDRRA